MTSDRAVNEEEMGDKVPAKKRAPVKKRVVKGKRVVTKIGPANKTAGKKGPKKKVPKRKAESDEEEYVPEKEEPDEALDVKLEDEEEEEYFEPYEDQNDTMERSTKKRKKRNGLGRRAKRTIVRVDPVTGTHTRVVDTHVQPDLSHPEFILQLEGFKESGRCPKCDSMLIRAHERHLRLCRGPTEDTIRRNNEREVMASLPSDIRSAKTPDAQVQKLMARLRKIKIEGIKSRSDTGAVFIVLGSTGRRYEVSIKDGTKQGNYSKFPRRCNCIDARTRRHDCKHCSSVILSLGFELDVCDDEWNAMWRMHLDDNLSNFTRL